MSYIDFDFCKEIKYLFRVLLSSTKITYFYMISMNFRRKNVYYYIKTMRGGADRDFLETYMILIERIF